MSITGAPKLALERLLKIAAFDTGQSRRVADFLLAWWNPASCGRFDLIDLWGCDTGIVVDIVTLIGWIGHNQHYPDSLGYGAEFESIVRLWRPDLVK